MPTVKEWEERCRALTAKASDVSRHLAYAGIAVGLFTSCEGRWPSTLVPLLLFITALALDLIHHAFPTFVSDWFYHCVLGRRPEPDQESADLKPHPLLNWPTRLALYAEVLCVMTGYCLIIFALLTMCLERLA